MSEEEFESGEEQIDESGRNPTQRQIDGEFLLHASWMRRHKDDAIAETCSFAHVVCDEHAIERLKRSEDRIHIKLVVRGCAVVTRVRSTVVARVIVAVMFHIDAVQDGSH